MERCYTSLHGTTAAYAYSTGRIAGGIESCIRVVRTHNGARCYYRGGAIKEGRLEISGWRT